jgi:hypothetical protein
MATIPMSRQNESSIYKSLESGLIRRLFNFFPAFRGSGARVTYISDDWKEVRIWLPLNWSTRNYMGTIYGGSMHRPSGSSKLSEPQKGTKKRRGAELLIEQALR